MKKMTMAAFAAMVFGTPASATVSYKLTVDTSSQAGRSGYVDLQFGPGCLGEICNPAAQNAFATVSGFKTDGNLLAFDETDPNDLAIGTTGTLDTVVKFDNQTATPSDFSQAITFGKSLSLLISFSGPAIDAPWNTGGNYNGTGFLVGFGNNDFTNYLFGDDSGTLAGIAAAFHVQQDGSILAVANPSGNDYTTSSRLSFATVDLAVGAAPEPSTWAMMILGFGAAGYAMRRRRKIATRVRYA